ncbi:MAG: hypothetical protein ABIR48_05195, partial [Gammaproteobacteria bacterium]
RVRRKASLSAKKLAWKLCLKIGHLPMALRDQYVFDADVRAQKAYVAKPYDGRIIMLWASLDIEKRYHENFKEAWALLALGGVESYDLPFDHIGTFREPHVRILADRLKACIDSASTPQTEYVIPHDYNSRRQQQGR